MSDDMKIGLAVVAVGIGAFFIARASAAKTAARAPASSNNTALLTNLIPIAASAWSSFNAGRSSDPGSASFVPYAPGQSGLGPLAPAPTTYGIDPATGAASPGSSFFGPPSPAPTTYGIDPATGAASPGSDYFGPPSPN